MYIHYNLNPFGKEEDDCVVRALGLVLDKSWNTMYMDLMIQGFMMKSRFDKNYVWGAYLKNKGFDREVIPNTCPDCYSVADFANDHPVGKYVLATDGHVVAVIDGNYYDTSDTGGLVPLYYWRKEN